MNATTANTTWGATVAGDTVLIKDGAFHRVYNSSHDVLEFMCVFDGRRDH